MDEIDEEIDGHDEPCEVESDGDSRAPDYVLLLREILPYTFAPQHRDPVSGSCQVSQNATHAAICKCVRQVLEIAVKRIRDAR